MFNEDPLPFAGEERLISELTRNEGQVLHSKIHNVRYMVMAKRGNSCEVENGTKLQLLKFHAVELYIINNTHKIIAGAEIRSTYLMQMMLQ